MYTEHSDTILLLQHDSTPETSLRASVERCGYTVAECSSFDEARLPLEESPLSLLLVDVAFAPPGELSKALRILLARFPHPLLLFFSSLAGEIPGEIAQFAQYGFVTRELPESLLRIAIENARWLFEVRKCVLVKGAFGECALCELRESCKLRRSEERFRTLVANIPGTVFRCRMDEDWTMLYMSDLVEELTGYPPGDFVGNSMRSYASLIHPEDAPLVERRIAEAVGQRRFWEISYRIRRVDGAERWVYEKGAPVFGEDGALAFLDGVLIDITDRRLAEEQLTSERVRLANVIEGASAGTWECNLQTGEILLNSKFTEMLGCTLDELSPIAMDEWISMAHPEDIGLVGDALARHVLGEAEYYAVEVRMRHRYGRWIWTSVKGRIISRAADGEPLWMYGTAIDITDRKEAEEEILEANRKLVAMQAVLEREATHDSLTGILNRKAIFEHLSAELARCRRDGTSLSVATCDIDHFKKVNDTYGHQTGDDVLRGLADLLRRNLREYDRIGRIGGEEFLLVLPGEAGRSRAFHERLVKNVAESGIETRSGIVHITLSIGVTTVSGDYCMDDILAISDKAMYRAKTEGRNRVVFIGVTSGV